MIDPSLVLNTINVDLIAVASIENTVSIKTDSFAPDEIIEVNIKY